MEMLEGIDLEDLVMREGKQPAARVLHILVQACDSLSEAHEHGLVHAILNLPICLCKMGNQYDYIKVLDFGLVITTIPDAVVTSERLTVQGFVNGTPEYIAPEQARGKEVDGRADIYALGCVAYWLLTGRVIFRVPARLMW